MTDQPRITTPGTGLLSTDGGSPQPVEARHLDDATAAGIVRNLLIGGEPGSGKTGLLNLQTMNAALDGPQDGEPGDTAPPTGTGQG